MPDDKPRGVHYAPDARPQKPPVAVAFLNPLLLFGCASVAAPIIIHLLGRRTVERTVWAAMRFLQESIRKNQRRVHLEDLLLLALRCLLLIFLALALARPTLRRAAGGFGQPVTAVIAIDHSYSMSATDGVSTRLDKAREAAEQLTDALPTGSSVAVVLVSDVARAAIPVPTTDRNTAHKVIRGIQPTDRGTDWLAGLRLAAETIGRARGGRKEVDLITDGQAAGWRQGEEIRGLLRAVGDTAAVRLITVGEPETRNVGISGLSAAGVLPTVGQALRFEVEVTNFGSEDAANVAVHLATDDEPPQDTTTIERLPAGGTRSVALFAKLRADGCHTVTARITPDHLPADDERTVALRVRKDMGVLLVDGDADAAPRDAATFFLQRALVPVPAAERERYFLKAKVVSSGDLDSVKLGDYEVIILADVPDLSPRSLEGLAAFLRGGGGLLVFPGPRTDAAFYNEQLLGRYRFLPAGLGGAHGDASPTSGNTGFSIEVAPYEHPLVSLWNDPAAGTLGSARFYRAYTLQPAPAGDHARAGPADPAGDPVVVLRFADGTPMLMERTWGAGRVLEFASTANTAWNDLPVRPAFVPLLHRALASVVNRRDEPLNVPVGGPFVLPVDADALGREATIAPPNPFPGSGQPKREAAHEQRAVEMVGDTATLRYENTDVAGPYTVTISGESAAAYRFAVQADTRESHLEALTPAQIAQFAPLRAVHWTPALDLKEAADRERRGAEFWLPFALLALACAIGETVLADWFGRSE